MTDRKLATLSLVLALGFFLTVLVIVSCTPQRWVNARSDWLPAGGVEQAYAICQERRAAAGGWDLTAGIRQGAVWAACMEQFGFVLLD